jgi:diguanylate cyclase (GGDEF)-like protein
MGVTAAKNGNASHFSTLEDAVAAPATKNRRILYMDRKKASAEQGLEESLASALQASDSELGQILQEVDEISTILKSPNPDPETLRVAGHPAVWSAVKQSLLDRELKYLALTDDLTCLFNRRGFFAAATQQLKRARRSSENLLLLFCDVDNLKKINDTHGHQEGDLALIRAADALEHTFRGSDILARLGGDEFVVLALAAPQESEHWILSRLERNLKKAHGTGNAYALSLSVGIARFDPKHAVTLGELMVQADKAMYEKKRMTKLPGKVVL